MFTCRKYISGNFLGIGWNNVSFAFECMGRLRCVCSHVWWYFSTFAEAVESPATKLSVATPYRLPDDHPDNWSDPEDPFLDESSSDSDPDFILESSASAIQANQNAARVDQWTSNSPSTHISSRTVSQEVNRRSSPFEPINSEVTQKPAMGMVGRGRGSPLLRMYNSPTSSPINPMKGFNNTAYPKKSAEGTSQPGRFATGSNVGIKQPNSPKRPVKHGNTQVSYGWFHRDFALYVLWNSYIAAALFLTGVAFSLCTMIFLIKTN